MENGERIEERDINGNSSWDSAGAVLELKSNNYIITERIDEGGNGTVWKATIDGDSRLYAIKVLKDDVSGDV